jgi:hypothetical protein
VDGVQWWVCEPLRGVQCVVPPPLADLMCAVMQLAVGRLYLAFLRAHREKLATEELCRDKRETRNAIYVPCLSSGSLVALKGN